MTYNKLNNISGWICGVIATTVYVFTADKFNGWWDTGEFIASAYKLEVVHQPGAPLFLMIQNLFSNLAFGDVTKIALWMNIGTALLSGLTIVFLFWTITALAKKLVFQKSGERSKNNEFQILAVGFVGALAYSFTDTFWYSAVETEVYAMSSLCTAVVFWLILKWEVRADQSDANKWLLLIAFVIGLSIGVHLLNLLTIPVIAVIIYYRKVANSTWQGLLKSLGIGVLILAFILWGVIQYSIRLAAYTDLVFVNYLGLSFGSGIMFFITALCFSLGVGIWYARKNGKYIMHLSLLALAFVLFGFSSYTMLPVRSNTNISLNNAAPDNAFSFLGYLSREQYQSEPLFKGPSFDAKVVGFDSKHSYAKDDKNYRKIESGGDYQYDKEMIFPRVYSSRHTDMYRYYLNLADNQSASFGDNLRFFFSYQLGHMYGRYFLWNFVGRQNDTQNHGSEINGNWLSGIRPLDEMRLSGQTALSENMKNETSRNTYYFLPLLLGIAGFLWQFKRNKKDTLMLGLLFFFTGIAIVIFINQTPLQPRERDYAYSGSFYVFAIWIGLGVLALIDILGRYIPAKASVYGGFALASIAVPLLLIFQNWDDHDRSDRKWTRDLAYNYLESCEPNAILFTYTDNDTFPLWYLQEVEGVRTDVRVVNLGYLQSDWYLEQSVRDINNASALPIDIDRKKVAKGIRDVIHVHELNVEGYTDIDTLLEIMLSDNPNNQLPLQDGSYANFLPTRKMQLNVNRQDVIRNKSVPREWEGAITELMRWSFNKNMVTRAELGMMSILANNNWERPIYFANMLSSENFMGLDRYLVNEGLVYKLMPIDVQQPESQISIINTDTLFENITTKFKWGNIANMDHFDNDYSLFVNKYLFRQTLGVAMDSLVREGKLEQGGQVALLANEYMPERIVNSEHAYINSIVVDTLLKTEQLERASKLADKSLDYIDEQLGYYHAVDNNLSPFDMREVNLTMQALERYKDIAITAKNKELIAKANAIEQRYAIDKH